MENYSIVSVEQIQRKILVIRGVKVMLDRDLAALYGVPTRRLNEAVKRNLKRFPERFMFRLTEEDVNILRSQNATANISPKSRVLPCAFTEYGVVMLSSVLNSNLAIALNIHVVEAFVEFRYLPEYKNFIKKVDDLQKTVKIHDDDIKSIFVTLRGLILDLTKANKLPPNEYIT